MLQRAIGDVFAAAAALRNSGEADVELRVQFVEVRGAIEWAGAGSWPLWVGADLLILYVSMTFVDAEYTQHRKQSNVIHSQIYNATCEICWTRRLTRDLTHTHPDTIQRIHMSRTPPTLPDLQ